MTKYCIKLISEVYFEFDYEGALKDSCMPEDYPDEIKAIIKEEAKKLSDKNFYVGYCNERREAGSWCGNSEALKEEMAGFVGSGVAAGAGVAAFTDEELIGIKEEIHKNPDRFKPLYANTFWGMLSAEMREGLHNEFYSAICTDVFKTLVKKLSPGEEKEVLTHMEWIECRVHLSDIVEYLKENNLPPFKVMTDEELNKLDVKPYDFVEGYKRACARESVALKEYLKGSNLERDLMEGKSITEITEHLKENKVAPFNKPLETPVEKTGENNE